MKKVIKIIIILLLLLLIFILSLSYTITENNNYKERIINKVKKHYQIDNIEYINYQDNYYIIKTKEEVIVLNKEFEEILKEKSIVLKENNNNYELVYKTNKLMYEKTTLNKNKVIYTYYDAKTNEKIKDTIMEK